MTEHGLPALPQRKPRIEVTLDDLGVAPPAPPPPAFLQPAPAAKPPDFLRPAPKPVGPLPSVVQPLGALSPALALELNRKSVGIAILLSLLFTGGGQVYCGRVLRGIGFWCAAAVSGLLILALIGLLLLPLVWLWAAIDAGNLARRQNEALLVALSQR